MTSISGTKDEGRLKLGIYSESSATYLYGRSMNTYNNLLTQLFTRLFGFSITIEIGSKTYTVNKKSFNKHTASLGFKAPISVNEYQKHLKDQKLIENTNYLLSDNLSLAKQHKLFKKMIEAIRENNEKAMLHAIHKGASTTKSFFIEKKTHQIFFEEYFVKEFVGQNQNYFLYTPLSYAYFSDKATLCDKLFQINGRIHKTDIERSFNPNNLRKLLVSLN